jgi:hypothetical protein
MNSCHSYVSSTSILSGIPGGRGVISSEEILLLTLGGSSIHFSLPKKGPFGTDLREKTLLEDNIDIGQ